jgi:hypothetical protein
MKLIFFVLACVLTAAAGPFKTLSESRDTEIAEMKKMGPYAGRWVGESHSETANAKISSMVCSYENEFMMNGVYFVLNAKCKSKGDDDAIESKWMCTYDAFKGKYKMWGFASTGIVLEYEGRFSGGRFQWKIVAGQYRFKGDMEDRVSADSLFIAGRNLRPDGSLMERSSGVFKKLGP